MDEPLLTKRLHISGLTPSLTPADLERRLSSFGKVKAMDGFGARDGLGDPRKFGFVTMEISVKGLEKCLNVLSGTTWKGAKLRIGEAKPDFRERLAHINAQPPLPVRPKRTRARNHGYPSPTLPLTPLTATAAASTPGWIVTPSGRVVRPIRIRPERPLEPMGSDLGGSNANAFNGKMKKRVKPPLVRARRRLIDPTKWDSMYLKGVFLDAVPLALPTSKNALELVKQNIVVEEDEEEDSTDGDAYSSVVRRVAKPSPHLPIIGIQQLQETAVATSSLAHEDTESIDVHGEANAALAMLDEMFEGKEDWDGRESVYEMEDLKVHNPREKEMCLDEEDEIEIVPRDLGQDEQTISNKGKGKEKSLGEVVRLGHENGPDAPTADVNMEDIGPSVGTETTAESASRANLKALFAPREEASFSLLEHLDLAVDLELDDDILGISVPPDALQENHRQPEPSLSTPHVVQISAPTPTTNARSRVTLDPSHPLLFPPPDSLTSHWHGAPMCFLFPSAAQVRGLNPLPPSITFTRSSQDTPESIREMWEKDKFSLTHEWKKAWREARGGRRGRVGPGGEVGGGY